NHSRLPSKLTANLLLTSRKVSMHTFLILITATDKWTQSTRESSGRHILNRTGCCPTEIPSAKRRWQVISLTVNQTSTTLHKGIVVSARCTVCSSTFICTLPTWTRIHAVARCNASRTFTIDTGNVSWTSSYYSRI